MSTFAVYTRNSMLCLITCLVINQLFISLLVVPACLRYLERLWGAVETAKFIAVSVTISNIIAVGLNWLEFIVFRNDMFL